MIKKHLGNSLTLRLTLLFSLAAVLILTILGFMISSMVNEHFIEQDQRDLSGQLAHINQLFAPVTDQQALDQAIKLLKAELSLGHGLVAVITDGEGNILFLSEGLMPLDMPEGVKPGELFSWQTHLHSYRGMKTSLETAYPAWTGKYVMVGMDISHHKIFLASFHRSIWLSTAIAALLMGALSWLATTRGLAPLRQIISTTARVTANKLDNRLSVDTVPVELRGLAETFNQMLERLEESFRRLSNFSADIAHELRTPISNLLTQTQVILSQPRTLEEYRETLYANVEELDHLSLLIAEMLFLAKADNGLVVPERQALELSEEISRLFEFYDALAESRHIQLTQEGEGSVTGDRSLLRQAFSNLLINAIMYGGQGTVVHVSIHRQDNHHVRLALSNIGESLSAEHLAQIFDRFYRVDSARQRTDGGEGVGLGLAITRAIVVAHGGKIDVKSVGGKTCFTVILPMI